MTENHYKEMEHLSAGAVDLIAHLLQPNPAKRARLFETMSHPWITRDGLQPLEPYKQPAIDHSLQTAVSTFHHDLHTRVHNFLFKPSIEHRHRTIMYVHSCTYIHTWYNTYVRTYNYSCITYA